MPSPKRNSLEDLTDAAAIELVEQTDPAIENIRSSKKSRKKSKIVEDLSPQQKEPTVRLGLDLNQSLHRRLSTFANKAGRTKIDICTYIIEEFLKENENAFDE